MLKVKKKYINKVMSNAKLGKFNTNDITPNLSKHYASNGMEFIFDDVCDICELLKCKCK